MQRVGGALDDTVAHRDEAGTDMETSNQIIFWKIYLHTYISKFSRNSAHIKIQKKSPI